MRKRVEGAGGAADPCFVCVHADCRDDCPVHAETADRRYRARLRRERPIEYAVQAIVKDRARRIGRAVRAIEASG